MQSTGAAEPNTQTQSLLQNLTERARTGLELTAQVLREQARQAGHVAKERVKTAADGKRLLDDGGESVEELVMAKHASRNAVEAEKRLMNRLHVAIIKLDDSAAKLKQAQARQGNEESSDFAQLADEHEARAAACRRIVGMLDDETSFADMTPEECDALAIVLAKAGCASALDKASDGFDNAKQKALASMMSIRSHAESGGANTSEQAADASQAPTLLQSLQDRAHYNLQNAKQAATDRVESASAGKQLLDGGGESVAQAIVAKKASLDAAEIDRDVAQRAQSALEMFEDSAVKLKAASTQQQVDTGLGRLAGQHEQRVLIYREVSTMLQAPIASSGMNLAECDALALVKVRDSCSAIQCRTNQGFEVVKNMLFASCSSEEELDKRSLSDRLRSSCV